MRFRVSVMYRGLVASGAILVIFGTFLVLLDLVVPMGVLVFGLPIAIVGGMMFFSGFLRPEPLPVEAAPGKMFCWYCMSEIDRGLEECPECTLPQHKVLE